MITTEKAVYRHLRQHGAIFTGCFVQGVFATNGLYQAVQSLGYSIPGDISVAGFDGDYVGTQCVPRLTTVEVPRREMGRAAASALLRQIAGGKSAPEWKIFSAENRSASAAFPAC